MNFPDFQFVVAAHRHLAAFRHASRTDLERSAPRRRVCTAPPAVSSVSGVLEGLGAVRVSVSSIPIEHTVKMQDFKNWVEREGGNPKEVSSRGRIRAILGLPR